MKFKYLFITFIAAIFLSSYMVDDSDLKTGSSAPAIEIIEGKDLVSSSISQEKEILVHFWSPKNASSRITNKHFSEIFRNNPDLGIEFVSICTDEDEVLAQEVMRIDGTEKFGEHFTYSDISERVFKDYNVVESPQSFLIGTDGKIKSVGVDLETLNLNSHS